jgi:hypothetical protein
MDELWRRHRTILQPWGDLIAILRRPNPSCRE